MAHGVYFSDSTFPRQGAHYKLDCCYVSYWPTVPPLHVHHLPVLCFPFHFSPAFSVARNRSYRRSESVRHCLYPISLSLRPTHLFMHRSHRLFLLIYHSHRPQLSHAFTPGSKLASFTKLTFPVIDSILPQNCFRGPYRLSKSVFAFSCFPLVPYAIFIWPSDRFSAHAKYSVSYLILSYRITCHTSGWTDEHERPPLPCTERNKR